MGTETPRVLRFAAFEVDVKAGEVRKHGRRVRLQDKPFQVLQSLLEHPGEIVLREELRARLWPADTFVDFDNGLNNAVNKVRRLLGDSPAAPKYVETVGRRGYRFIGAVETPVRVALPSIQLPVSSSTARTGWAPAAAVVSSLAVLPLANLSDDAEQEYFSDGLTDALISQIAGIRALRVISRHSSMRYKGSRAATAKIARELGVDALIEGTVLRVGARVRVTVQLVNAATDSLVWSGEWDRALEDLLLVQSEIARAVAQEVRAVITPDEARRFARVSSVDPEAYDLFLRGRFFWSQRTREGLLRSVDYFRKAIQRAPLFAEAHAAIAESMGPLGYLGFLPPHEVTPAMKAAATAALSIDPDLVEGLNALAACAAFHEWRLAEAETLFQRAIAVNPNYVVTYMWYGQLLENTGRQEANVETRAVAVRLDPLNLRAGAALGIALFLAGRADEGIARLQSTLELDPNYFFAREHLARIDVARGRLTEAIDTFQSIGADGSLGHALGLAGRTGEARAILRKLQERAHTEYVSPFRIALVQIGLGERDAALASLERAFEIRAVDLSEVKVDPRFAPLASERRFAALLQKMGLTA
jgi:TolB-like protein/Tfp pilus assembly protein PilF